MRKALLAGVGVAALILTGCTTSGNDGDGDAEYPPSRMTIYSPFNPGGGIDLAINELVASLRAEGLVDIDLRLSNIPGGSGLVAVGQFAANNVGDDSTLLLTSISTQSASLQNPNEVGLDVMVPIGGLYAEYSYAFVPNDSPFQTFTEVMDALKADPNSLTVSGGTLGSADNIIVARLAQSIDISYDQINYLALSGDEHASNLLGHQVDVAFSGPDLFNLVESGDVRVLGVSSEERIDNELLADVPTFTELGYEGAVQLNWRGLFGMPDMPDYALEFWNDALQQLAQSQTWQETTASNVWDITGTDKDEFARFLAEERESLTTILTDLGLISG